MTPSSVTKTSLLEGTSRERLNEVVDPSPAPEFRATVDVGVQGVETLYYRKGLFSFAAQRQRGIEVVSARCDALNRS